MLLKVHINDLVALFLIVFHKATSGPATGSPYERFFMGSTRLTTMKSIATVLATALYKRGRIDQPEAKSATIEEVGRLGG